MLVTSEITVVSSTSPVNTSVGTPTFDIPESNTEPFQGDNNIVALTLLSEKIIFSLSRLFSEI